MNRLFYSSKQEEVAGANLVLVDGDWKKYTEWCHEREKSNWDDAVVVYEREEEPQIKVCKGPFDLFCSMPYMTMKYHEAIGKVKPQEVKQTGNFKARCVKVKHWDKAIAGKTYDFIDGKFHGENGYISHCFYKDVDEWNYCNINCKFELVEEPKMFTKSDLRTGMRVKLRDGSMYIILKEVETMYYGIQEILFAGNDQFETSDKHNDDLTHQRMSNYDIMAVYKEPAAGKLLDLTHHGKLIWQRTEPKKMTHKEIETALGFEFEYVKN